MVSVTVGRAGGLGEYILSIGLLRRGDVEARVKIQYQTEAGVARERGRVVVVVVVEDVR